MVLQYMVKRKGLDFTEYGLVDARAAKRQRMSGDNNDPKYESVCKVGVQVIAEVM